MVLYGDQKYSAMAKTVGLPAAIATRMLLESRIYLFIFFIFVLNNNCKKTNFHFR